MEIATSARKHGFTDEEILHAWENAIRFVVTEQYGEDRVLVIGATPSGAMLELIAVPVDGPARIIHADLLRPKYYEHLR